MNMKKIFPVLLVAVSVFSFSLNVQAAFPDVSSGDVNAEAINFLQSEGIVEGYPDGTFGPDLNIVRAEMVKIVVESSGFELSDDEECFPDLEKGSWYAKYVCTAFEKGIVEGYPDGTFQPGRNISRVEAIKIFLEAEGLSLMESEKSYPDNDVSQWYAGYVTTAFELNYLPFVGQLNPAELVRRRDFAEMYFRLIQARKTSDKIYVSDNEVKEYEGYYADVNLPDVVLTTLVPKKVLVNEVYFFEGTTLKEAASFEILNLGFDNTVDLGDKGEKFSVPLWFGSRGLYTINLGDQVFEIQAVNLMDDTLESGENLSRDVVGNVDFRDLVVSVDDNFNEDVLVSLNFSFNDEDFVLYNRQGLSDFSIPMDWLRDYWTGEDEVSLSLDYAILDEENWVRSGFSDLGEVDLKVVEEFETIVNNTYDENIDFSYGTNNRIESNFRTDLGVEDLLYVIRENGLVEVLNNKIAVSGNLVKVDYKPSTDDYQIIEVNDVFGQALVNYPIYRENMLPLKPDPYVEFGKNIDVTRENALLLINESRSEFGLEPLVLNQDLSELAQFHADDMYKNNYVAHADLDGRKVSERKLDFGIKTFVGENIARNINLFDAHNSLMRSAAHRINLLDENWTDVGIGLVYENGVLYLVQNFSFDSDVVVSEIESFVSDSYGFVRADDLTGVAQGWADLMVEKEEYSSVLDGEILMDRVADLGVYISGNFLIGARTFTREIIESIDENFAGLETGNYDNFGFDMKLGDDGLLYFVLIITS